MSKQKSNILKIAILATGFSGVVAEYVLSTLATYFLGDSIFQWVMIVSLMLFAMGLGSRLTKKVNKNLLTKFLLLEFCLSFVVSYSALFVYSVSVVTSALGVIIYALSITIGLMIGMEIPLVIRINDQYESLKHNISNILEHDYYGSLIGGVFFAFIALPFLTIRYTPYVLGIVNLSVAIFLMIALWSELLKEQRKYIALAGILVFTLLSVGIFITEPIISYGEQVKYKDKLVLEQQTKYQKIVITKWKNDYWLYLNGNQQLCTRDELMYHEPIVHPVMTYHKNPQNVLIMGGGDGCAAREVLEYESVKSICLVDLDEEMTNLAKTNKILTDLNQNSLSHPKVKVINEDGHKFVQNCNDYFDVIIIDLPDPRSVELSRLYTLEFYMMCKKLLRPNGMIITQAGSPYFATKAFKCIHKTMKAAGYKTAIMHNQIITMGEWGWVVGINSNSEIDLKSELKKIEFQVDTKWINNEAMSLMLSFGKNIYLNQTDSVKLNSEHDHVLYRYYLKGNWDLY
ncbi:MAG: polyamine aminopropyltransferase [Marinifilaceae bacterium]|jgi:spermidine synthase|nr:polyamine aminopropyltransferase [Marinifilaceae bacterium]